MVESIIMLLIWVCVVALVIYLIIWVLTSVVGLPIPQKVVQILWVIFALVVILYLVQMLLPLAGRRFGLMEAVMPMLASL